MALDEDVWLKELHSMAKATVLGNLVRWRGKEYLTAGALAYKTIWVRDACHCTGGLLILDRPDVVENLIDLYLDYVVDGQGPKSLDTIWNIEFRTVHACVRKLFCLRRQSLPFDEEKDLNALYKDSRGSRPIDSNQMILWSLLELDAHTEGGHPLMRNRRAEIEAILHHYDKFIDERGLIVQEGYSDWQDSQDRHGAAFLTNLIYYRVCEQFMKRGWTEDPVCTKQYLTELHQAICKTFLNEDGVFKSLDRLPDHVSLDGNLLALRWGFLQGAKAENLYRSLRNHALWKGKADYWGDEDCDIPGFATYPNYPYRMSSYQVKISWLHNYHDSQYWGWLMGLSAEICYRHGDVEEGDRILKKLLELALRDKCLAEVYEHRREMKMVDTWLFTSEYPFSWSGAYVLEALKFREGILNKRRELIQG